MTNAVIYLRQSRDTEGTGLAVDRQRTDCVALCESRGWSVLRVVTDNDTSASKGTRPGWTEVLQLAETGTVDVIVGWHVDRLTRKLTELEHLIELSERTGVKVATVSGDVDLTTDAGRLVGRILASVARGEVERKGARQRRASLQAAERVEMPSGKRAFGYDQAGEIIPIEADAIRELFAKWAAGASVRALTTWLNKITDGNTEGRPWSTWTVRNLIKNPRYAAIRSHCGVEVGPGTWQPIVDESVYRAAVQRLTDPARASYTGSRARKHLGSFRFLCGKCGEGMAVNYNSAMGYRVFRCPKCGHARRADPIDSFIDSVIAERLRRSDLADLLAKDAPDIGPLKDRARDLRTRMDLLADDYADGNLTGRQLERATQRIAASLRAAEDELAAAGRSSALAGLLTAPDAGDAWLKADVGIRGQVLDMLASIIVLPVRSGPKGFDPDSVRIEWRE